jgi:thiamine biosynthesis lipoprotein
MGDALSTALFCMPLEDGKALVESMEGVEALWLTTDGVQTTTSGWHKYVKK